jgi:VanZ family protein
VNRKILQVALWFCAIAVLAAIFLLSSQPGDVSTDLSNEFMGLVFSRVWPAYNSLRDAEKLVLWSQWSKIVRKWGHFCVFALLGFFLYAATRVSKLKKPAPFTAGTSFLYAASDELHQLFVPGRTGQFNDVLIDFSGSVFGIAICAAIFRAYYFVKNFANKIGSGRERK